MPKLLCFLFIFVFAIVPAMLGCSSQPSRETSSLGDPNDPYGWLEDIEGKKSLDWVKRQNEKSVSVLGQGKRFTRLETLALEVLEAEDKIPKIEIKGNYLVNFWQDPVNVRGIWRRTSLEQFKDKDTEWDVLLDIDLLAKKENEDWYFREANCLGPQYEICLVSLSKGGKDAVVVREFNTKTKTFISSGFSLPEAKTTVDWLDKSHILVSTDFGKDSLTESGYSRIVKKWKRGTDLSAATQIYEGSKKDMGAYGFVIDHIDGKIPMIQKREEMFSAQNWTYLNSELQKIPLPYSVELAGFYKGYFIVQLRKDWVVDNKEFTQGSLVAVNKNIIKNKVATEKDVKLLYKPQEFATIAGVAILKDYILVNVLENVNGEIYEIGTNAAGFTKPKKLIFAKNRHITLATSSVLGNDFFFNSSGMLEPNALHFYSGTTKKETVVQSLPARFNSKGMVVQQLWATSQDGTKVPYFIVGKKSQIKKGSAPTLLHGYGGFEISKTPEYNPEVGKLWLERGGLFVVANIRGGGEFGPKWHQAALKENRHKAYDDFIAVAEDLIKRKITVKDKLAIYGRSNGGLLVGAVMAKRPDLFKAVLCQVPLLDMIRYPELLAGSSWMAEYGDPRDEDMKNYLLSYSPYHNVKQEQIYPNLFLITSTRDDRVHPGHARKLAAKLNDFEKNKVWYFEETSGGHSSQNMKQKAHVYAMMYEFLYQNLF